MSRELRDLIPEYETGSSTGEDSAIKPSTPAIVEIASLDSGTTHGPNESPYDTGKARRIVTRGKITHEP